MLEGTSKLESARANEFSKIIRDEVNKHGSEKTLKKFKDKISNLTDHYKRAKENNKKSGDLPAFPLFYEDFDEIFSTRGIIKSMVL